MLTKFCNWCDAHYRGLMLVYMMVELVLLSYIAWRA